MLCIACMSSPFNINVVHDGCSVRQPFVTNMSAIETKLTEMHDLAL